MKHISLLLFGLFFYFSSFTQETWHVDNPHSNLRFEVGWEDFSVRTGEFKSFSGTLVCDSREDLTNADFKFEVEASSVDVIADRLADRIKNENFLDVEKFPLITYFSNNAAKVSKDTYLSNGKITICGVEKEQEVEVKVKGFKDTKKGEIYALEVSLVLDRTDFGLEWGSPRLGEKIKIVAHLIYMQKKEA